MRLCRSGPWLVASLALAAGVSNAAASEGARAPEDPAALATLRRAHDLYIARDYKGARALVQPLVARTPPPAPLVQDAALYLAAESTDLSGDPAAAAPLFHRLAQLPSPFAGGARWREADCLHDAGRLDEAASLDARLLAESAPGGDRAVALWNVADAADAAHDTAGAVAALRRLFDEAPEHPLAERAAARIAALTGAAPTWTAEDRMARATALDGLHQWDRALAELAQAPTDTPPAARDAVELLEGQIHYHARDDYRRAAADFLGVWSHLTGERAADALFHGARSLSRADRDDDAIRLYGEVVRRFPRSPYAAEAEYLRGWLDYNRGRYRAALPVLQRVLARFRRSRFVAEARFCIGFSDFLLGKYAAALPQLHAIAGHPDRMLDQQARYWEARTLQRLGRTSEALAAYRRLVGDAPLTWYALLSRARLAEAGVVVGPFGDAAARMASSTPAVAATGDAAPDAAVARDTEVQRIDELLAVGFADTAAGELAAQQGSLLHRYGPARALPVLLDRYRRAGDYRHPAELAELYEGESLRLPPEASGAVRAAWEAAYPRAWRGFVEKYGPTGGNPSEYLYAIMRQESGFNPNELSYADAIGLLQMIPPTSRRVAPEIGVPYTDDVLYDPEGNIRFGAWYIGHLAHKFGLQIPLAAGSYNAGPKAMMRWCDEHGARPMDELVELIPYTQTRDYMKRVTANYAHYLWLYEGKDYRQPLVVDPKYDKTDGIDY